MGVGYKGDATYYHSISENVPVLAKTYSLKNGYFGVKGTSEKVRVIYSDDPAKTGKDFYDKIAYGGIESNLPNGKGVITKMADGSIITFRPTTKSDNNPGVDINIEKSSDNGGLKKQKIHFE
jgi:hypothetical protein